MLRANGPDAVRALSLAAVDVDDTGIVDQRLILEGSDFVADIERAMGIAGTTRANSSL